MSEMAEWLKEAKQELYIDEEKEVALNRWGTVFHDPKKLKSTIDMEMETLSSASLRAKPCTNCFGNLHTFEQTHFVKNIR